MQQQVIKIFERYFTRMSSVLEKSHLSLRWPTQPHICSHFINVIGHRLRVTSIHSILDFADATKERYKEGVTKTQPYTALSNQMADKRY